MSHSSETRIFSAAAEACPSGSVLEDGYLDLCKSEGYAAFERKDKLHHVFGSTRNGYAIYTLKKILEARPFPALAFLTDSGHQYQIKGEFGQERAVTLLDHAEQERVIDQMQQLLSELKADPDVVYEAEDFGFLRKGDVEAALSRSYVSAMPALDPNVKGEDGEGIDYLFVYIRSVLAVVRNAYAEGLTVVFELEL